MFAKFQPSLSIALLYILTTFLFLYRFLFGNIYGIFITSLAVYYFSKSLFGISPLGFDGLMQWIMSQSEVTKTAILSAFISVIGFLIAFTTATSIWKSQTLANLKLQAAGELHAFFDECSKLATDCKIYANFLVETVDKIQKGCSLDDANFLTHYNFDKGELFKKQRERLCLLSIEVYGLLGKYTELILSTRNLKTNLDSAANALKRITERIWIQVPFPMENDPNPIQTFVNQVNIAKCTDLKNAVDENFLELNFSSGVAKGDLMSSIVDFNFWKLLYIYKERKAVIATMHERYRNLHKNG